MKAIVHIGTEKTGTTSIQKFLYQNRRKLRGAGYHFLQSAGTQNNRALPAYCIDDEKADDFYRKKGIATVEERQAYKGEFLQEFDRELGSLPDGIHTVIMSSEHFHSRIRTEEEMDNVYELLSPRFEEIRILCYLREQVTTCTSYYSTHLKSGGVDSFDVFMKRCAPSNYYFNYLTMLGNWERCFGLEALDIHLFGRTHFLNGDLLDDFTSKIGPALVGKLNTSVDMENESLVPMGQAFALAVNRAFPVRTSRAEVEEVRSRCKKLINQRFAGKGQQLPLEKQTEIFEAFAESNEELRLKLFADKDKLFDPPSQLPPPQLEIDDSFVETLIAVLKTIKKEGRGILDAQEYSEACAQIITSVIDSAMQEEATESIGKTVNLTEDNARVFRRAAIQIEKRDLPAAAELMALAYEIEPRLRRVKSKLDEYAARAEEDDKVFFQVAYFHDGEDLSDDEKIALSGRLQEWILTLDLGDGSALQSLKETHRIGADGEVVRGRSGPIGYTVIRASSMEEALEVARSCPYLEFGASIEVAQLNWLPTPF